MKLTYNNHSHLLSVCVYSITYFLVFFACSLYIYAWFILFTAAPAITIAYFEHYVLVHAKMFIYIHILFLFSIHGISHHHHHLLPQWSNVNMSSSRSVTASNFLYWQKNRASSFPYAFVNVSVFVYALFLGYASFGRKL